MPALYDIIQADLNKTMYTATSPNQQLFDTKHIENEKVKDFVKAKGRFSKAQNEARLLKQSWTEYVHTASDDMQLNKCRDQANEARTKFREAAAGIDWNKISKTDYEAALNATCAVNNQYGGFEEALQEQALVTLTIESMNKADIIASFEAFDPNERAKWLRSIANNDKLKQHIPDNDKLSAYVQETKDLIINKDPRPDPTDMYRFTHTINTAMAAVHSTHVSNQVGKKAEFEKSAQPIATNVVAKDTLTMTNNTKGITVNAEKTQTKMVKNPISRFFGLFDNSSNSKQNDHGDFSK